MKILIKFPTRSRPEVFKKTLLRYYECLSGKHDVSFIISADRDDPTMQTREMLEFLMERPRLTLCIGDSRTKIEAINANLEGQDFDILIMGSDDMIPEVMGFDDVIVQYMQKFFPDLDGCLHFNDGHQGRGLNTLPIMGKKLYDYFGYVYHPSYQSLWCDNEFTFVTNSLAKAMYIDRVIIRHGWVNVTGSDHLHFRNDLPNHRDHQNYLRREAQGFPK